MDALAATKAAVFIIAIKTNPAFFISPTNRGKSYPRQPYRFYHPCQAP